MLLALSSVTAEVWLNSFSLNLFRIRLEFFKENLSLKLAVLKETKQSAENMLQRTFTNHLTDVQVKNKHFLEWKEK